jgi:hypothetical protein
MLDWWELPGPGRFIQSIVSDLQSGINVVVSLPQHMPQGFIQALRCRFPSGDGFLFERLKCSGDELCVKVLFDRFLPDLPFSVAREPRTVADNDDLNGYLFLVHALTADSWPAWRGFLEVYQRARHGSQKPCPPTFCLLLEDGLQVGTLAVTSPCLNVRTYRGAVTSLDMLLYVSERVSEKSSELLRQVATAVISNLALWDLSVADSLCAESLATILEPNSVLSSLATNRGWTRIQKATWEIGAEQSFEGSQRVHSAWLASSGESEELTRRIWRGQIAILFPFIEERRQDLLRSLAGSLVIPHTKFRGTIPMTIHDPARLEIGDIDYQVRTSGSYPDELKHLIKCLKRIRDDLAHFAETGKCVASERLRGSELRDWEGILRRYSASTQTVPKSLKAGAG